MLGEFVCEAIVDPSAVSASPPNPVGKRAENEGIALPAEASSVTPVEHDTAKARSLQDYVGRRALYLEGGKIVVVRVEAAETSLIGMTAVVAFDRSVPVACQIRRVRYAGEELVESWGNDCPFGDRWSVAERWPFFELGQDRWGASQNGFRLLFSEDAIGRFARHDLSWIDEYYP